MAAIHLQILEVDDPHNFWAKESQGPDMTEEGKAFHKLHSEMQRYYKTNHDLCRFKLGCPEIGTICAGQRQIDKQWYRVRVKEVYPRPRGPEVSCEFMDYGRTERIPSVALRTLGERFLQVPYQTKHYCLDGIQPITLVTNYELFVTTYEPCTEWEISARKFMQEVLKEAHDIRALHMGKDADERHLVKIYIKHELGECLNEILVQKKYAQYKAKEDGADSGLDMTLPSGEMGYASDSGVRRRETPKNVKPSRATHHRRAVDRMYDSDTEGLMRVSRPKSSGLTLLEKAKQAAGRQPQIDGRLVSQGTEPRQSLHEDDRSMESSVYHSPPEALRTGMSVSGGQTAGVLSTGRGVTVTDQCAVRTSETSPARTHQRNPEASITSPPASVASQPAVTSPILPSGGRGLNPGHGNVTVGPDPPVSRMRGVSPVVEPVLRPMSAGRGLAAMLPVGRGAGIMQSVTPQERKASPVKEVSPSASSTRPSVGRGAGIMQSASPHERRASPARAVSPNDPSTRPSVGRGLMQPTTPEGKRSSPAKESTSSPSSRPQLPAMIGRGQSPPQGPPSGVSGRSLPGLPPAASPLSVPHASPTLADRQGSPGRGFVPHTSPTLADRQVSPGRGFTMASRSTLSPGRGFITTSLSPTPPSLLPAAGDTAGLLGRVTSSHLSAVAPQGDGEHSTQAAAFLRFAQTLQKGPDTGQQSSLSVDVNSHPSGAMPELKSPPSPTRVGKPKQPLGSGPGVSPSISSGLNSGHQGSGHVKVANDIVQEESCLGMMRATKAKIAANIRTETTKNVSATTSKTSMQQPTMPSSAKEQPSAPTPDVSQLAIGRGRAFLMKDKMARILEASKARGAPGKPLTSSQAGEAPETPKNISSTQSSAIHRSPLDDVVTKYKTAAMSPLESRNWGHSMTSPPGTIGRGGGLVSPQATSAAPNVGRGTASVGRTAMGSPATKGTTPVGRQVTDNMPPDLENIDSDEEEALLQSMISVKNVKLGKQATDIKDTPKTASSSLGKPGLHKVQNKSAQALSFSQAAPVVKSSGDQGFVPVTSAPSAPAASQESQDTAALQLQIALLKQQLQALSAREALKSSAPMTSNSSQPPSQPSIVQSNAAVTSTTSTIPTKSTIPTNNQQSCNKNPVGHKSAPGVTAVKQVSHSEPSDDDIPFNFISVKSIRPKVIPKKPVTEPQDKDLPTDFISVRCIKPKASSSSKHASSGTIKEPTAIAPRNASELIPSMAAAPGSSEDILMSTQLDPSLPTSACSTGDLPEAAGEASLPPANSRGAAAETLDMPALEEMDAVAASEMDPLQEPVGASEMPALEEPDVASEMPPLEELDAACEMPPLEEPDLVSEMPPLEEPDVASEMPPLEEPDVDEGSGVADSGAAICSVTPGADISNVTDLQQDHYDLTAANVSSSFSTSVDMATVTSLQPSAIDMVSPASSLRMSSGSPSIDTGPMKSREAKSRVTFSDVDEYLGPETKTPSPARKAILKKTASSSGSDAESPGAYYESDSDHEDRIPGLRGIVEESRLRNLMMSCSQAERTGAAMLQEEILPCSSEMGLLIDGMRPPKPATSVSNFGFCPPVLQGLLDNHHSEPSALQSYVWPALMRNRSVVCVAPVKSHLNDSLTCDRCLTYMLPFASHILLAGSYEELPVGSGPLAIVLCSSWRRAQEVYNASHGYLNSIGSLRRLVLFGGGNEEASDVSLINGCEVLITTVNSVLRALDRDVVHLNRMCHLVLDDGDLLVEYYTDEVRKFMSAYAHELQERGNKVLPRQLMLLGSEWTVGMGEFMQYMSDPLVIIDSKLQAAAYGKVRWRVHSWTWSCRLSKLLDLIKMSSRKTVIWTSSLEDALSITKALTTCSHSVLTAYEGLAAEELDQVSMEWNMPHQQGHHPILVATDSMLLRMNIENAEEVIHYDLPEKRVFSDRLWIMRKNFNLRLSGKEPSRGCLSVVLITEECTRQAPTLVRILEQNQECVPQQLRDLARGRLEGQEEVKEAPLCHQFKAYGHCRNQQRCDARHMINAELDEPGCEPDRVHIPTRGKVQLLVTHMVDAACYWGRLLSHQVGEGPIINLNQTFMEMHLKLNVHMANLGNRLDLNMPTVGDLYCFEDIQHSWHRVLVKRLGPRNKFGEVVEVEVEFVDRGAVEKVKREQLRHIPPQFVNIPYQVVEVHVCQLKPVDGDVEWSDRALYKAAELVWQQEVAGNIVLSLGHTLWLSSLRPVQNSTLGTCYGSTVTHHMLQHNQAVRNPDHLKQLYDACRGRIELPEILEASNVPGVGYNSSGLPQDYKTMTLPTDRPAEGHVYVSTVDSPGFFFLQDQDDSTDILSTILEDIRQHLTIHSSQESLGNVKVGSLVLSTMPSEDDDYMWYRGKILAHEGEEYDVFYVDYGDREWVKMEHLRAFPSRSLNIPFQAMECSLFGLKPKGEAWLEAEGDVLLDFTRSGQNKDLMKKLQAEVKRTEASQFAGPLMYHVQLIDHSAGFPVCLTQEFIARGHALPSEDLVTDVFPLESTSAEVQPILRQFQAVLQSMEDQESLCALADQIKPMISQSMSALSAADVLVVLSHLGELLAYLRSPQVICDLLPLTLQLATATGEDLDERLVVNLLRILNRADDDMVREQLLWNLRGLAEQGYSGDLSHYNGLKIFINLAKGIQKVEMLENCLWVIAHILPDVVSNPNHIYDSGAIELVCQLLRESSASEVWSPALQIVSILSPVERWNDALRKHGGIDALVTLVTEKTNNPQVMSQILSILITLTERSLYTRETLMEKGHLRTFQRLMLVELPDDVILLCQDMVDILTPVASDLEADEGKAHIAREARAHAEVIRQFVPKVPGIKPIRVPIETELNNMPLDPTQRGPALTSARPQVRWMQDKHHLCLTVEVVNTRGQEPFTISEDRIAFSAVSECVEYCFDFQLYELIIPESKDFQVRDRSVTLGLHKKTRGFWPRLLKTKCKLSYLKVDFENIIDSESDDESDSEEKEAKLLLSSPLAAINKHRRRQPVTLPPAPPKCLSGGLGVPEFDDVPVASTSSEHSDDSGPENDEKRLGHFTL